MLPTSSQRFLRISAIHHNMTHFISESTVHEYQYPIEHFPETSSSLMSSGSGTIYHFSIWSRSSLSSLSLKELWTSFTDACTLITSNGPSPQSVLALQTDTMVVMILWWQQWA